MRKLKNILSKALACFLFVSTLFGVTGCKKDGESTSDGGTPDLNVTTPEKLVYQGTHVFTAPDTDVDLVKNGVTEYKIVAPAVKNDVISSAINELVLFFKEATGITLEVVSDKGLTHSANAKYISIGENEMFASAGLEIDRERLGFQGLRIVTKDDTIYLFGGTDYGTLCATYDFLQIYFDWEIYYEDCITMTRNVQSLKLKNFDVTDIPDIDVRSSGYRSLITGDWAKRFRTPINYGSKLFSVYNQSPVYDAEEDAYIAQGDSTKVHTSLCWLPMEQYRTAHPKWYTESGRDLCYNARGDEAELEAMLDACLQKAIETLKIQPKDKYPLYNVMTLTIQDGGRSACTCTACVEDEERYGAKSAAVVQFMNRLRQKLDVAMETLDEKYQRDDLILTFFAYSNFELAPTKNLDEVKCVKGVSPFMAMGYMTDYQASVYAEINDDSRENLENWGKLCSEDMIFWTYSTKFSNYMYPVDTFSFYNEGYSYLATFNPSIMYNQSQVTQNGTTTAWHNLKAYLDYKLSWDSSLDANALIEDYMQAMFGSASNTMKKLFDEVRLQCAVVREGYTASGTLLDATPNLDNADFWPYATVRKWLSTCEQAYTEIEKYKTLDPAAYATYKAHIDAEWVSPAYIILKLYSDNLGTAARTDLQKTFKQVVTDLGMTNLEEGGSGAIRDFCNGF